MSQSQSPQHIQSGSDLEKQADTDDRPASNRTSQQLSHSSDTSVPLLNLYLRVAEDHDWRKLKLLKGDTDQILVFCGLFSATVAALIVPSFSDLSSSGTEPVVPLFLLEILSAVMNIFALINQDVPIGTPPSEYGERESAPSQLSIVLINSYWLLSLLLSISCALMALSLQRWAQPPTGVTSSRHSLPEQARLRTLFAAGIERLDLSFLVEVLHCLIHIAFSVFLVGLLLYLYNVNFAVFSIAMACVVPSFMAYGWLSAIPIIRPASPYSTPFSNILAVAYSGILHGTSRLFYSVTSLIRSKATPGGVHHLKGRFRDWYLSSIRFRRAQELASQLDGDVLKRTLDMLRSDDDLEEFFEAIPGFCVSKMVVGFVDDPQRAPDRERLAEKLIQFWNRTLSSNRVSESIKGRRLIICIRAIEAAGLSIAVPRILHTISRDRSGVSRSVEIGHSLGILRNGNVASLVQAIVASIISANDERDERWFTFAKDELGLSEDVLRRYLDHGDSVLLANLIHITRQFFDSLLQRDSGLDLTRESLSILPSLSSFDILNTLPELQQDFCALWNKIVQQAQSGGVDNNPFIDILVEIRDLCVALHGNDVALTYFFASSTGRDDLLRQPASYPLCKLPNHRTQEAGCSTGGASHSTATTPPIPLSESPVGDVPDTQHFPTPDPFMAQPNARSPSGTGDAPRSNEGITGEPASTESTNALSQSGPQVATIAGPRKRRTFNSGSATHEANGNAQDLDPAI